MESIVEPFIGDPVTRAFTIIIVVIFAIATLSTRVPAKWASRIVAAAAGVLTSIGVLGTFFGIYIGLQDFDVRDIESSVPILLDGLKIAFATSIVGMFSAITFTIIKSVAGQRSGNAADATPQAILVALDSINASVLRSGKAQTEALSKLRDSIAGDGDTSMHTQMQKLRVAVQDGDENLIKEFRQFTASMAENNYKAIIAALEQVVRDFNKNLTEQFGENFKELNLAVGTLVVWQEQYREHLAELESRLANAVASSEASRDALRDIADQLRQLPPVLSALAEVNNQIDEGVGDLTARLSAFARMKEQAESAFPEIERNLLALTEDFAAAVRTTSERNASCISAQQDALTEQSKKLNDLFSAFDEQMQTELNRALQSLGGNLASLSGRFVDDYRPLTEKLARLVRTAEELR